MTFLTWGASEIDLSSVQVHTDRSSQRALGLESERPPIYAGPSTASDDEQRE
jgi:hypothetical protein